MALSEAGWFDRAPIEIHSSDANSVAIERARRGVHSENRIRDLSPELRPKYFIPIRVTRKCPQRLRVASMARFGTVLLWHHRRQPERWTSDIGIRADCNTNRRRQDLKYWL
jgi:chemotaxis methyl-accepting protein methylase